MKLSEILKEKSMINMSTVDAEGQPKSRVMNMQFIVDGKICFGTSNTGNAYAELKNNNKAEFAQFARAMYIRIGGEVKFTEGELKEELKARMAEANPQVVEMYTEAGFNEKMEIAYFENPSIRVVDFKTHKPVTDIEIA